MIFASNFGLDYVFCIINTYDLVDVKWDCVEYETTKYISAYTLPWYTCII
jgi:hypothetical protein